jgi:quinol monooxygenase YgiN
MDPRLENIRAQLPSEDVSFSLIVRFKILKDQLSEFTKLARWMEDETAKESGVDHYRFFTEPHDPTACVLLETWKDFRSLDAHFGEPHFQQFMEKSSVLCDELPQIDLLIGLRS